MSVVHAHEVGWDLHQLLEIWVERRAGHVLVTVSGELTVDVAGQLRDFLAPYTSQQGQRVLVDASRVTAVDGAGMAVLGAARRRARAHRGDVRVLNPSGDLRRRLAASGFMDTTPDPEFGTLL